MTRSPLVDVTVRLVLPAALALSVYFLLAGHNQPGGGFVGGLVAGAALSLAYVAGGVPDVRAVARFAPTTFLGLGLLLAATTALVPVAFGDAILESAKRAVDVPLLGTVNLTSVLVFDTGVYLVVVGLVLAVLEAFGDEEAAA
jgi:multisubunit Na+/H+ antiporter MnhB subunit